MHAEHVPSPPRSIPDDAGALAKSLRASALALVLGLAATGCPDESTTPGGGSNQGGAGVDLPAAMSPLPPAAPGESERFITSSACAQCHLADADGAMHDEAGLDISPVSLWRSSMMAFAARDPFYLATVDEELLLTGDKALVDAACTRCHAPASALEHERQGDHSSFAEIATGTDDLANLARDGVTCSMCHQIAASNLGDAESFGGGFKVGFDRAMFGPHEAPKTDPMEFFVNYTPTYGPHVASSELCATCHTVFTPIVDASGAPTGGDFLEQAAFLEWSNSASAQGGAWCGTCHLPAREGDGSPTSSPIAKYPAGLSVREPYGRHSFVGANAYMLRLIGDNLAWTGSAVPASELAAAADRSEAHVAEAAQLDVSELGLEGDALRVAVTIENRTGHKLPTGYPTRRVWLHLVARDAGGDALFESGAYDARGAILGANGPLDVATPRPHIAQVEGLDEVPIYEAVPLDARGAIANRPLAASRYGKDNRILPAGWSDADPWIDWIRPVGVSGDADFVPGSARVEYRLPSAAQIAAVEVELLYQTIAPEALDRIATVPAPAAVAFSEMAATRPALPIRIATAALAR